MRTLFVALWAFLVVAAMGATAAPGATTGLDGANSTSTPAPVGTSTPTATADSQATNRTQNASLGSEISSFMSSTAASTEHSVDRGMWHASVTRTPSNAAVAQRVSTLAERYERLRTVIEQLREARANGSISGIEYRVRRATLRAELRSLGASVASLAPVAARSGTANARLAALRDRVPAARRAADSQSVIGSLPPLGPSNGSAGVGGLTSPPGRNVTAGSPNAPGQGHASVGASNTSSGDTGPNGTSNASARVNGSAPAANAAGREPDFPTRMEWLLLA